MTENKPITNIKHDTSLNDAKQLLYVEQRKVITEAFYINTKNLTPKENDKH